MNRHLALRAGAIASALIIHATSSHAAPAVLPDFVIENAVAGVQFNTPTAIAFAPDRMLVAEKGGTVWVVQNGAKLPQPMWSGTWEVLNNGDRGLIGLAVDPDFVHNGFVYMLYTVDPDSNGVDGETVSFGRVTRYRVRTDDPNRIDESTRTVLVGRTWRDGFVSATLSHGVGALQWGNDGSLMISCGDGAHYDRVDAGGQDPAQFLPGRSDTLDDLGSYRAQSLGSLSGKILRVNPASGAGYASNPFYDGDPWSARSRVWAYGMRNPFRFCLRPGTGSADTSLGAPGSLYIGDVGLNLWEEIDVVPRGGLNFGWPNYEGRNPQPLYASYEQPLYGMTSFGTPTNPAGPTPPTFSWHHNDSTLSEPSGIRGNCTSGGVFYGGALYPPHYRGRFFFSDFGRGWLRVALMDSTDHITQLQDFATGLEGPVAWATDPASGDVHYVSIYTGEVRRIRYIGQSGAALPPVARASAGPNVGAVPATISFSSLGSYDPTGETISCTWNFGDGDPTNAGLDNPTHVFARAGEYQVILSISTPRGAIARDTVEIVITAAAGFPVTATLDSLRGPDRPLGRPWAGSLAGLQVAGGALVQTASSNQAVWDAGAFGANQEVHVRFDSVGATATEQDLLLKVQGTSWSSGAIQVVYSAPQSIVVMTTYTPGVGFQRRGGPWTVRFQAGDEFGARAYSNGTVQLYRNGEAFGIASVLPWAFAGSGGRVGVMLRDARGARLTDFGGGTVSVRTNAPPVVAITSPADGSFYVDDQTIDLGLSASDEEDPAASLTSVWSVDLIHNNHLHPNVTVVPAASGSFEATSHDDGTGVHYQIRAMVTDTGGLSDTAMVSIYPEVDLEPGTVAPRSGDPGTGAATAAELVIRNRGRMPSAPFRWMVLAGSTLVAQGDTLIAALDSVRILRTLPGAPPEGYDLRVVVDSLQQVPETDEANNARTQRWGASRFPTTLALDSFDRADGALGAPWAGNLAGLRIASNALIQTTASSYAIWNAEVLGTDQEAWIDLDAITATAPEHDLLLKVQGTTWTAGAIQVVYSAVKGQVRIYTYAPTQGWQPRGGPWTVRLEAGDRFGARAFADGRVRVFRNGVRIGETTLGNWPFAASGGRVGLMLGQATQTRIAAFGGGSSNPIRSDVDLEPGRVTPISGDPGTGAPTAAELVIRNRGRMASAPFRWMVLAGPTLIAQGDTLIAALDSVRILRTLPGAPPEGYDLRVVVDSLQQVPETDEFNNARTQRWGTSAFPSTLALDEFERPDGVLSAPWVGNLSGLRVAGGALTQTTASSYAIWNADVFGADQEAWIDFDAITAAAPEHDLLLKVQGTIWTAGAIQVVYSAVKGQVRIYTYAPTQGWQPRGGPWTVRFEAGDHFGARAFADGRVRVFRNGVRIGETTLGNWPFAASGGRVGLILGQATQTRIERFGGGTAGTAGASRTLAATDAVAADRAPATAPAPTAVRLSLSAARPNPSVGRVSFTLELPDPARVSFDVFDVAGRRVWSDAIGERPAGPAVLTWPGLDASGARAAAGVYLARVEVDGRPLMRRVTLAR